tara:strand:- start:530 stop:1012 length:483 start_codon:yes stop_codon:yes gene_type:complete
MAFTIIINETETTKTLRTFDCYCRSAKDHARNSKLESEDSERKHRSDHTDRVIQTGSITLPNGEAVRDGQGAAYHIGSDSYPFTILGWTKTGKTVFFQKAERRRIATDCPEDQRYLFAADLDGKIEAGKWTTRRGHSFYAAGRCGGYTTDGFAAYADPHR